MTAAEFRAAGLYKLNDAELRALNRWLEKQAADDIVDSTKTIPSAKESRSQIVGQATADIEQSSSAGHQAQIDEFGKEQIKKKVKPEDPVAIRSTIKGEFRGWDGKTIFRLANGAGLATTRWWQVSWSQKSRSRSDC